MRNFISSIILQMDLDMTAKNAILNIKKSLGEEMVMRWDGEEGIGQGIWQR